MIVTGSDWQARLESEVSASLTGTVAILKSLQGKAGTMKHRDFCEKGVELIKNVVSFKLQLARMEFQEGFPNDPKHSMLYNLCAFRVAFAQQASLLKEYLSTHQPFDETDEENLILSLNNDLVGPLWSCMAPEVLIDATRCQCRKSDLVLEGMLATMQKTSGGHHGGEKLWKIALDATSPLPEVLRVADSSLGQIVGKSLRKGIKDLQEVPWYFSCDVWLNFCWLPLWNPGKLFLVYPVFFGWNVEGLESRFWILDLRFEIFQHFTQAVTDMDNFVEKVGIFAQDDAPLAESHEFKAFSERVVEAKGLLRAVQVQYIESALAYALNLLLKPDHGGKAPESLKKVIAEQISLVVSGESGIDESFLQPVLLKAAKEHQGWHVL